MPEPVTIYTDGGARGNPGPAGIGVVMQLGPTKLEEFSAYVGEMTNNQAEYTALLAGLERATKYTDTELHCILDSELVVRQLEGRYKVRSKHLQKMVHQVRSLEQRFRKVTYEHTRRAGNAQADKLVNQALDARTF